MVEINNSIAAQVGGQQLDLTKTLSAISQIDLARAHAGLYGLQAQQEARKLSGLEYLKSSPTDYIGAIQRGLDPSVGSTLQTMSERERQYGTNPQRLSTESTLQLTSAGKNLAETGKIGAETKGINIEQSAKLAQGVIADPSNDSVWRSAVEQHYKISGGSELEKQQLLGVKDPNVRLQIAKAYGAQGVPPSTFGAPHPISPTQSVTTPGASYSVSRPVTTDRPGGALPASPRVMGDDEAVKQGLYSPTPEQIRRGVTGPASPNQQVANRFGAMTPSMTPAQVKETESYGETLGKMPDQLSAKAEAAKGMNFTLDQMKSESANWPFMGKGTQAAAEAAKYLKPFANAVGSTVFDNFVGDFEAFQKNAGTLVRQAVKDVSSRAAVQEFEMIQSQLPSADMSRGGFSKIVDQFQAVNDYQIAKQRAAQKWRNENGTLDNFDSTWNKNMTPSAFLVNRMSVPEFQEVASKLQKTPQGRSTLNNIRNQMRYANDNGLF
jgi:hypothetical protein